jgi:SHS2 domain-containing protein
VFKFLEDIAIADIAFEIEAPDLNSLFSDAADAFLAVLIDNPESVRPADAHQINLEHRELDILLYLFLQELVYLKDVKLCLLKVQTINIQGSDGGFELKAGMRGEVLDPNRHQQRADVKAVTLHHLEVRTTGHGFHATVVLDI